MGLSGQASAHRLRMTRLSHHPGPAGVCHPSPPPPLEKMSKKMECSCDLFSVQTLTLMGNHLFHEFKETVKNPASLIPSTNVHIFQIDFLGLDAKVLCVELK